MLHDKIESFFSNTFDDGTLLKLEIFAGYIREWLPVFLTHWGLFIPYDILYNGVFFDTREKTIEIFDALVGCAKIRMQDDNCYKIR